MRKVSLPNFHRTQDPLTSVKQYDCGHVASMCTFPGDEIVFFFYIDIHLFIILLCAVYVFVYFSFCTVHLQVINSRISNAG